jgi:hypothetical protein
MAATIPAMSPFFTGLTGKQQYFYTPGIILWGFHRKHPGQPSWKRDCHDFVKIVSNKFNFLSTLLAGNTAVTNLTLPPRKGGKKAGSTSNKAR